MFLFVGLGNPGKEYEKTRHNIGFMAVDSIADAHNFNSQKVKFHAILREGKIDNHKIILLKPNTYMNRSGLSVGEAVKFYKIPLEKIIVFQDEIDLPLNKIRLKKGGGHGGHNGLRDIDAKIGKDYRRVRIGVGHPGDKDKVSGYVLSKFSKEEQNSISLVLDKISQNSQYLLQNDDNSFLNAIN